MNTHEGRLKIFLWAVSFCKPVIGLLRCVMKRIGHRAVTLAFSAAIARGIRAAFRTGMDFASHHA
jgi:hypothetical protein